MNKITFENIFVRQKNLPSRFLFKKYFQKRKLKKNLTIFCLLIP